MVPFAAVLGALLPDQTVKLVRTRRDFRALLSVVQAAALLHQRQRERTAAGAVVATLADYATARRLLGPILDATAAEGVTPALREVAEAVVPAEVVSLTALAARLGRAKSTVSWHVTRAVEGGYLTNLETQRGRPAQFNSRRPPAGGRGRPADRGGRGGRGGRLGRGGGARGAGASLPPRVARTTRTVGTRTPPLEHFPGPSPSWERGR